MKAARAAGLDNAIDELKPAAAESTAPPKPPTVPVDAAISGIDVLDMDKAMHALWREAIYAESAMGCTGPVLRVQEAAKEKADGVLRRLGFI